MDSLELQNRTKQFALDIIKLVATFPKTAVANVIKYQLLASATSVGANYRSACRGRSQAEFISKMNIVLEEADESLYWLELVDDSGIIMRNKLQSLIKEADELVAIFTASIKTAKGIKHD